MNTHFSTSRQAGVLLILGFTFFAAHLFTIFVLGNWPWTVFLVLLYGLALFLFSVSIKHVFNHSESKSIDYIARAFGAHGILVIIVCSLIMAHFKIIEEFPDISKNDPVSSVLWFAMDKIRTGSFIFLGVGTVALGYSWIQTGSHRWLGIPGIAIGSIVCIDFLIVLMDAVAEPTIQPLVFISISLGLIYLLVVGGTLVGFKGLKNKLHE